MRLRGRTWAVLAVVAAAIVGGVVYSTQSSGANTRPLIVTDAVTRRTIQDQLTLTGTLSRLLRRTVTASAAAQVTDVPVKDGQTVKAGQSIIGLNGREMVAEPGSFPFFRSLTVGDSGQDVEQLDQILASAGYNPGPISTSFTSQAQAALAQWQAAHGYPTATSNKPATLTISLQPSAAYTVGSESSAGLTIYAPTAIAAHTTSAVRSASSMPTLSIYALNTVTTKGTPAVFVVYTSATRTAPLNFSVSEGGTAPADEVLPPVGPFTIPAGASSVQVQVPTRLNGLVEPDVQLSLQLQPGSGYAVGNPATAATTIKSSDVPEMNVTGGGSVVAGGIATFTITADQPPLKNTTLSFQVSGTAQPGQDYKPLSTSVLLPAGQTSVTVSLSTLNSGVVFEPTDMITGTWPIRIGQVFVKAGDALAPGGQLFSLTDSSFTVSLSASPSERTQLKVGQSVTVQLQGGSAQSTGVISQLDDFVTVNSTTNAQTYMGKISVGDLGAADGATVTINVTVLAANDVLTVPIAAVKQNGLGKDVVRVIDLGNGHITEVSVQTGLADSSYMEIDHGLSEGQVVIVDEITGSK